MKTTEFKLTFSAWVNLGGENPEEILANLRAVACDALNRGKVTGEGPAIVEEHSVKVERVKKEIAQKKIGANRGKTL